jgi:hypothetical protein
MAKDVEALDKSIVEREDLFKKQTAEAATALASSSA